MTDGAWCILRTAGKGTLRLADSLTREGIEAWTPRATLERPRPRSRGKVEKTEAIMPTFVFARAEHLDRLAMLEERPGQHESFHLFRYLRHLPMIADRDLEPLRSAELRALPKRRQRHFRPGQLVRVPEGSFGGMSGRVEKSEGGYTLVCFGGAMRVKIATFILREDAVMAA